MPRVFVNYLLLLVLLMSAGLSLAASTAAQPAVNQDGSIDEKMQLQIKAKIDALTANKSLDEVSKAQLLASYQASLDNLANTSAYSEKAAQYEEAVKTATEKTKKLQQELVQIQQRSGKQKPEDLSKIPLEELEQRLILEKGKLDALDERIGTAEKELLYQVDRPQQIRQENLAAQEALESAQKKLDTPADNAAAKPETEAAQILLRTAIGARKAELKMLSVEANSNPIRVELLKAELQSLKLQKDQISPAESLIETLVNERRQQEAIHLQNELSQVEKTASGKHALIQQAARDNIKYSKDLQSISEKIETYTELNKKVEAAAGEIEADYKSAEKKISLAGLSPVLGKILREQRRNLVSQDRFAVESDAIQDEMAVTSLEQFKVEDKLKLLSDSDAYLKELMDRQVDPSLPQDKRMLIQAELRDLLENQKDLLNKLSSEYTAYLRKLGDFDFSRQQLLAQATKFAKYLDERLLWVPSSAPINGAFLPGLYESAKWLLSPRNGFGLLKDLSSVAWEFKFFTFLALCGIYVLPKLRSQAKLQLQALAKKSERIYTDSFSNTMKAMGYTLVLVLPLPVFLFSIGWLLNADVHSTNFSKAIGAGLRGIVIPMFALQLFYRLFADNGIAVRHLQWQKQTALLLHRQVAWLRFVIIPAVFLINCTSASEITAHSDSLGRLALIIAMGAMSVLFGKLLSPATGLVQTYLKENPEDVLSKLRFVWYPFVVIIPIAVIGFAVAGYYLSALELQQKLVISIRLIFGLVIVYGLVVRWLTLVNRELALKNAIQKRKAAAQTEKQEPAEGIPSDMPVLPVEEQLIDIPTINAQTIKLLIVFIAFSLIAGMWMIWSNILPAFSFLDRIVLWQHLVIVDNQETYQPITLNNLLLAGLYVFIVVVSVRNFPGLMEMLVFTRLSITAGGRYAVNQLARYIIIAIGFICVANQLGGSWSQVQWLVAALSVGLGFGLQEIFANLVSGIILLFERPIRVGDTVTINSVTGKVSRIQMRATTIIDLDHKELIVPNKTFITTQLVNWTLSDTTTRIQIPVAIAYGSDVELVHSLMLEVARTTPQVLEDPAPSVVFAGIKEGGLEFTVTVFVSELSHRTKVTHNLHIKLEKMLRENKIELPSHAREVHHCEIEQKN